MLQRLSERALGKTLKYTRGLPARSSSSSTRQWSTPLAKTIAEAIQTTGPISIAQYMRQCLTSPDGGYYATKPQDKDQFGVKGDFITSPEISQVFGELCACWFASRWIHQSGTQGFELIELGPGRGTLMNDMLRVCLLATISSDLKSVYMIETSPSLREKQKKQLCGDALMEKTDNGYKSRSKYTDIPIIWCKHLDLVPKDSMRTPFFMANEFFDALPIHAFQSTMPLLPKPTTIQGLNGPIELKPDSRQRKSQLPTSVLSEWRELVITPTPLPSLITTSSRPALNNKKQTPEFQLSVAEAPTRASLIIPEASPRYRVLKNRPGSIIEVSPDSIGYVSDIAKRIDGSTNSDKLRQSPAGAALIIDYGPESTVPASTLRGIRAHELVSPLSSPGEVDISVDVDFQGLADATIDITKNVDVYGPIEQGSWLQNMGIQVREDALTKHASDAEHSESIRKSIRRLTERGGGGMGRIYKVLAIVAKSDGKTHPAGF